MQKVLERIAEGQFEYETGALNLSVCRIELSLRRGESIQGSFIIESSSDTIVSGHVFSDSIRMNCLTSSFEGTRAEIFYSFSAKGMEEGDTEKGVFSIVSSAGEYSIPFMVSIAHGVLSSSMGPIKNLFHFANLARSNWSEAVNLFYHPDFVSVFHGSDLRYLGAYRGLSRVRSNEFNVDEFLVEINKKQKIEYIPMESSVRVEDPFGVEEERVTLTRNGWGCTALAIETEGDFLFTEKRVLSDDDFLGNICNFAYHVDASRLHAGNNYGRIRIYNAFTDISIDVLATRPLPRTPGRSVRRELSELVYQLMEFYVSFRVKKISSEIWLKRTGEIIDRMNSLDEKKNSYKMFRAQLLITQDRINEASWILDRVASELEYSNRKPEEWCYYLYLTSLINRNEAYVDKVTEEVEQIYEQYPDNWRIAWLLLYLREDFSKSPYKKWIFIEQQFYGGCTSPVLYAEAISLLNANPTLVNKLSAFEIQILTFAAKRDLLRRDMIIQIHTLSGKVKNYSERLLYILEKSYDRAEDDETLTLICNMLMQGGRKDYEAYLWYKIAVDRELRITRLFEFFMMSVPENYAEPLPKMVVMYFAYHSELDYEKKAFLFVNVLKYKDKMPEIYETYKPIMDCFILDQIRKGHVDRNLAYLYRELLVPLMLKEDINNCLVPIIFSTQITVLSDRITQAVLIYDKLKGEMIYPVIDRKVTLPIYGNDYTLLLQDCDGNRLISDMPYDSENLMIPGKYVKEIDGRVANHLGLDLYSCAGNGGSVTITDKNAACYKRLWESDRLTTKFRQDIRLRLAQYYYDNDMIDETDEILGGLVPEEMGEKERAEFIRLLIRRSMYEKAYDWICRFGDGQIDLASEVRLISRLILRNEYKPDSKLLLLSYGLFERKKYDDTILRYLASYYDGMTRNLRDIWKAGISFDIDVTGLEERILVQHMYTGFYIGEKSELFHTYVKKGARKLVEIAYLTNESYGYFVKGQVCEEEIFTYLTRLFYRGEKLHDVCKLSYLKFYSEKGDIGEEVLTLVTEFLGDFLGRGIYFPFFMNYGNILPAARTILDKTMIEYHTSPGARVTIHYVIESGRGDEETYEMQVMKNMYEGIFVHSFVLFFGETLQYYICEEADGEEQLTESGTITKSDTDAISGSSRYSMLNDLMVARNLEDYRAFGKMYGEYTEKQYMMEKLFSFGEKDAFSR